MAKKKRVLTSEENDDIRDIAISYADADAKIMNKYGLDICEIEEILLSVNVERCEDCEWYVECGELVTEDGEPTGICEQCRRLGIRE